MVLIGLKGYLDRYGSKFTKFQLKWSILDRNRAIFANRPRATGVGHHSARAQGAVRNCVLLEKYTKICKNTSKYMKTYQKYIYMYIYIYIYKMQTIKAPLRMSAALRAADIGN